MAHAVSALYSKFNRMSPTAAAAAALLHVAVALVFLLELPRPLEAIEEAIEFTVEEFKPPMEPQVPAPPAPEPAAPAPTPQPPTAQATPPPPVPKPTPTPTPT
ncbi:MAG: hypothetical protein WCK95_05580, partial [Alphaproteobacteria bacterium]